MLKQVNLVCSALCVFCLSSLQGDQPGSLADLDALPIFTSTPIEETPSNVVESTTQETPIEEKKEPVAKKVKPKLAFKPFTGKVKGKKVRLRLQPDTESAIIKELSKGDLLAIVGEAEDFWVVEAPTDLKAYVFRSFVLDNQIEGNRVNVRSQPNLESPVIAHLNSGDTVVAAPCATNNKWNEIQAPSSSRFYIAKDYIENCGGPEVKAHFETRLKLAKQEMETAEYFVESEMQKAYPNIDFDKVNHSFQTVIQEYSEFTDLTEKAKESLAKAQEQFLDKRIVYLEAKALEDVSLAAEAKKALSPENTFTDKMKLWEPAEESLYLSWINTYKSGTIDEFYEEQKLATVTLSGILEPYLAPVKCKPGDYILRSNDLPVGYVYSTAVNLQALVGKKVTLVGAPRPNNNFAFPAYFIFSVEN